MWPWVSSLTNRGICMIIYKELLLMLGRINLLKAFLQQVMAASGWQIQVMEISCPLLMLLILIRKDKSFYIWIFPCKFRSHVGWVYKSNEYIHILLGSRLESFQCLSERKQRETTLLKLAQSCFCPTCLCCRGPALSWNWPFPLVLV